MLAVSVGREWLHIPRIYPSTHEFMSTNQCCGWYTSTFHLWYS